MLTLYAIIANLALVVLIPLRIARGRDTLASFHERLCIESHRDQARYWLHAASIGEANAARALAEELARRGAVVMTVNTESARKVVRDWKVRQLHVVLAPLDGLGAATRFVRQWRPDVLVHVEHEVWPTRFSICEKESIPVYSVAARMSERAAGATGIRAEIHRQALGKLRKIWPADLVQAERYLACGVGADRIGAAYNPKLALLAAPRAQAERDDLDAWTQARARILFGASVHPEDLSAILPAFAAGRTAQPDMRLILAPRHPEKADDFRKAIERAGLSCAQLGRGERPEADTQVYLADSIGDMPLWYRAAGMSIIGGTFFGNGGHSPVEAVQYGSLPIHGPDTRNNQAAYDLLLSAGCALPTDAAGLAGVVGDSGLWAQASDRIEAGRRALATAQAAADAALAEILTEVDLSAKRA